MINNEKKHIHCNECVYAKPDITASDKRWTAIQCTNYNSDYFQSLLNIDINGRKLKSITWTGCSCGRKRD